MVLSLLFKSCRSHKYHILLCSLMFCPQASELLRDMTLGANMRVHLVHMVALSEPDVRASSSERSGFYTDLKTSV